MIKAIKDIKVKFPQGKFYYDDIESLYNLMGEKAGNCEISTDEYKEIANIIEIKGIKPKSMKIGVMTDDFKYTVLYIDETYITFVGYDTVEDKGIASKLEDIFNITKKKTNALYVLVESTVVSFIVLSSFITYYFISGREDLYLLAVGFGIYSIPLVFHFFFKNRNIFILDKTRDEHSFYKENKEWIIPFTAALFAFILGKIT